MTYQFYATFDASNLASYIPDVPVLLPASSWARKGFTRPALPSHVRVRAADSGGYVASKFWGEYRYSLQEYVQWLETWSPGWAACMDYCCEPELEQVTQERQRKTTVNAWEAWNHYKRVSWAWVPTIQGLEPGDYARHAREMKPLIEEMRAYYVDNPAWRVGIGTLCRRISTQEINEITGIVRQVLPGVPLQLWGVKIKALREIDLTDVVSSDSSAWNDMWGDKGKKFHEQAREQGLTRQRYVNTVKLLEYIQRVQEAIKENEVRCTTDVTWVKPFLKHSGYTLRLRERGCRVYASAVRRRGEKLEEVYLGVLWELKPVLVAEKLGIVPAGSLPNTSFFQQEVRL